MHRSIPRLALLSVVVVGALALGAATAGAHGGPRIGTKGDGGAALVTEAAKQLDVTRAKLVDAIQDAAAARIDEAVEDGDVEEADADDLKAEAQDNLRFAMSVSRTRTVASNLGVTTTKLNTGFRAARKALILARIDEAVEDGDLEADEAAELKAELEQAKLPGYKAVGFGRGFGGGSHGFGR
jgi:hypothetical protein